MRKFVNVICPNCKAERMIRNRSKISLCKSCTMMGKKNRGPGTTLKAGYERVVHGNIYVRMEDGSEIAKHRLLAAYMLGRPITTFEIVRFKDSNPLNCEPSNLEIVRPDRTGQAEQS